jgi:hypothetical protein
MFHGACQGSPPFRCRGLDCWRGDRWRRDGGGLSWRGFPAAGDPHDGFGGLERCDDACSFDQQTAQAPAAVGDGFGTVERCDVACSFDQQTEYARAVVRDGSSPTGKPTLPGHCLSDLPDRVFEPHAFLVVMLDVGAQYVFEVAAAEDQEPVETLVADGADESLCIGVRLRRLHRRMDHLDSFTAEEFVEGGGELAVAVVDQGNASARERW